MTTEEYVSKEYSGLATELGSQRVGSEPRLAQLQSKCSFHNTMLPHRRTESALVFGPGYTGEPKSESFILGHARPMPDAKLTWTAKKAHNLTSALLPCLAVTHLSPGQSHVQEADRHTKHSHQLHSSVSIGAPKASAVETGTHLSGRKYAQDPDSVPRAQSKTVCGNTMPLLKGQSE